MTSRSAWTSDELSKLEAAEELEIALLRQDGSLRNPVTIWVVRHGDAIYVRSVNGRTAAWFRAAQDRYQGHIQTDGVSKDVVLVETDDLRDELDAAYRAKYRRYASSIVATVLSPQARAATLKVLPRP